MNTAKLTFIGGGNMATSLILGLIADGYEPSRITVSDLDQDKLARLAARCGIRTAADNHSAASGADVIVLSVKPQVIEQVARGLAAIIAEEKPLVISIAAGVQSSALKTWLGGKVSLVRTMPNTPAMLQAGATGMFADKDVSTQQRDQAESIMRAVGITEWVADERMMDVVTAVSGSGPAYFFLFMEAMEESARAMGMEDETARMLILQTALGAARMAIESQDAPAILREKVTSPGGTTEKALEVFAQSHFKQMVDNAMQSASRRSHELSNLLAKQKKLNNGQQS